MNRIYLVRHGENRANLTKEFSYKRVDYSLTPKGILQAQQTADYFRDKKIDAIYSSPLKRAIETAKIVAIVLNLNVIVLEDLREVNVGCLEGQPVTKELWAEFNQVFVDWRAGKYEAHFPGGEDYHTLWTRTSVAMAQIVAGKSDANIIAVGHGGMFTAVLKDLCPDADMDQILKVENHNCSITEMIVGEQDGRVRGNLIEWSSSGYLHGEAADLVPGFMRTD